MTSHIDLESVGDLDDTEDQKRLFEVIKAGFQRPGDVSTKAAALADDLRTLGRARKSRGEAARFIEEFCVILIDLAYVLPPDHPWQATLVQAVHNLQQTDEDVGEFDAEEDLEGEDLEDEDLEDDDLEEEDLEDDDPEDDDLEDDDLNWKYLPQLGILMRDFWYDPTWHDDWTPEEVSDWHNFNSFAARILTNTFAPWLNFPVWELRESLEEKLDKGPILDSRLWVATEWILCCGDIFFEYQTSEEELDEGAARSLQGGSLCKGIAPLSFERLAFWKKRLLEMLSQRKALGLSDDLAERVAKSAEKIGEFESRQSVGGD